MILCTLKKHMAINQINQSTLSEKTAISRPTLLQLIRNENQNIKYETIESLCKFFQLRLEELLLFVPFNIEMPVLDLEVFEYNDKNIKDEYLINVTTYIDNEKFDFSLMNKAHEIHALNKDIILSCRVPYDKFYEFKDYNLEGFLTDMLLMHDEYGEWIDTLETIIEKNVYRIKKPWKFKIEFSPIEEDNFDYLASKVLSLPANYKADMYNILKEELED